jgi:hypothetical protein
LHEQGIADDSLKLTCVNEGEGTAAPLLNGPLPPFVPVERTGLVELLDGGRVADDGTPPFRAVEVLDESLTASYALVLVAKT